MIFNTKNIFKKFKKLAETVKKVVKHPEVKALLAEIGIVIAKKLLEILTEKPVKGNSPEGSYSH